ncbi:MAG: DNA-directed DNA polymerase II small subunit [Archaeoglobaceae archaeon]|nr:DNA-directed DNA polymerase II small subunit [Archaeoglobaceae archaeon]MCX8151968.1 DNA-directed DNA polymerase II small subunit [Archaeoglobaceae archaeon]MDW8013357.1 DNA-directed DNA polymerase II small subunit [Archaeoglobaceae archaeon]
MTVKNIDVAKKFSVYGYNVHPEAIEIIKKYQDHSYIDLIIKESCKIAKNDFLITKEHVLKAIEEINSKKSREDERKRDEGKQQKEEIEILKDVTGNSFCEGKLEDFLQYFRSRYEKIFKVFTERLSATPIGKISRKDSVTVVGIVNDVREISKGFIFEIEDPTGSITCIAIGKAAETASTFLGDEVVAVSGNLRDRSLIVDRILFPDVPIQNNKVQKNFKIAFISDTHFGSRKFLEKEWKDFVDWINSTEEIKYLIVAGDIVDGVGIYPNQENELSIISIGEQYEVAAAHFDEINKKIKIIISTGNHDAVRQAEPQPALPKEFRDFFPKNTLHVGNPSLVSLEGVKVLIYHGRSLDDVVSKLSLNYDEPQKAIEELIKRRHLSPKYGEKCPIAPEREDYLVIEDVPDIIHCGHVHTHGLGFYRGIFMVNSSTWQAQTDFQKKMNLNPKPGIVTIYRPGGEYYIRSFAL